MPAPLEDSIGAPCLSDRHGVRHTFSGVDGGGSGGGGGGGGLAVPTNGDVKSRSAPKETELVDGVDSGAPPDTLNDKASSPSSPPPPPPEAAAAAVAAGAAAEGALSLIHI